MKNKLLAVLLCLVLICPTFTVLTASAANAYTVAEAENLCDGIVAFKRAQSSASSVQKLIDGELCASAGISAEFYIIALSQSGSYDFSKYEKALLNYLTSNETYSATTREKYALALIACGSSDGYISKVCDNDIGGQGLMSLVFGLHLLNNGYSSSIYGCGSLIDVILSYQLTDGGWAVIGSNSDVDVTAMTLQALAPYYGVYSDVTEAIENALDLLSQRQLSDGGFSSMGVENCESAAQVLTALSALGIDQNSDSRFIKDGTVLDSMLEFLNYDGSFGHAGSGFSESATMQALYAIRSYVRMRRGQSPLYILDNRSPSTVKPASDTRTDSSQTSKTNPTKANNNKSDPSGDDPEDDESPAAQSEPASQLSSIAPTAPAPTAPAAQRSTKAVFQPTGAATNLSTYDEAPPSESGYKLYAVLAIILAALIASAVLYALKKRGFKHYLSVVLIAAAGMILILITNFESAESYHTVSQKPSSGTVTMTIRCDVILDEDDRIDEIPDDCVILPKTEFTLGEGETAYDILLEASKAYDIQIDNKGSDGSAYISGINYLYEFDYGSLSGWMYRVNGEFPEVGCQGYYLSDGDSIEWLYTKEIGKDLE